MPAHRAERGKRAHAQRGRDEPVQNRDDGVQDQREIAALKQRVAEQSRQGDVAKGVSDECAGRNRQGDIAGDLQHLA